MRTAFSAYHAPIGGAGGKGNARKLADFGGGALGVDLNAGRFSAALAGANGKAVEPFTFPRVTYGKYGKSWDQTKDAVRKVAAPIAALAKRPGVPVVSEKLGFAAGSAFDAALASVCLRRGSREQGRRRG
ncbi:MAG: hypothetical protein KGI75_24900 [Rhizobiaceae bacterium]|nr:hypothetical protein [Rhizobiaceae bacterium]